MDKNKITHYINAGLIVQTRPFPSLPLRGQAMNEVPSTSDAYLTTRGDQIESLGSMSSFTPEPEGTVIDLEGGWVFPTWVDAHTHAVFPHFRSDEFEKKLSGISYQQIAREGGGILNTAKKLHEYSEDRLFEEALERLKKIAKKGTGAVEIKSGYGLSFDGEMKMLRVIHRLKGASPLSIKATLLGAHALPEIYKNDKSSYLQLVNEQILPKAVAEGLVDFVDIFCETGYFDARDTEVTILAGKKFNLAAKIHTNQFTSIGGIQMAIEHNILSVDHLEVMTKKDIRALGKSHTIATLLPIAPFFLNDPYPPGRALIDSNAIVALATDFNPGSAPSYDMALAMNLACLKCGLLPNEAYNAATINAAFSMRLEGQAGCLWPQMPASFFITPPLERLSDIPYRICSEYVDKTILRGREWM